MSEFLGSNDHSMIVLGNKRYQNRQKLNWFFILHYSEFYEIILSGKNENELNFFDSRIDITLLNFLKASQFD